MWIAGAIWLAHAKPQHLAALQGQAEAGPENGLYMPPDARIRANEVACPERKVVIKPFCPAAVLPDLYRNQLVVVLQVGLPAFSGIQPGSRDPVMDSRYQ